MSVPKSKSVQLQPYPIQTHFMNGVKLPKLHKRKKRNLHTKNPYQVKKYLIPDDSSMKPKKLNGFLLLAVTKNDMPHEIFRANLSRLRIVECTQEDQKYFINLEELDVSENQIKVELLGGFPVLQRLKICANNIQQIQIGSDDQFNSLKILDLSFNYLEPEAVKSLSKIPNLNDLSISNNELLELPEQMDGFKSLQKFDVSDNSFSSSNNAHTLWYALASIPNLIHLNISKNFLRGIHTEKLVAGNFLKLEHLDVSYNSVENQHNLICARNFKNLKVIIVTGNPFAMLKEHQGIEMEIHARTGGKLINEDVPKPYLRKKKNADKPSIRFEQMRRVDAPPQYDSQKPENFEEMEEQEEMELPQQEGDQVLFVTEHPNQKKSQKIQDIKIQQSIITNEAHITAESKLKHIGKGSNYTYEEFKKLAFEILGEQKDYEGPNVDLRTAYKNLRSLMNRPDGAEQNNFEEPHYLQPTASIQRYKFHQQTEESNTLQKSHKVSQIGSPKKEQTKNGQSFKEKTVIRKEDSQREDDFNYDLQNIYKQ